MDSLPEPLLDQIVAKGVISDPVPDVAGIAMSKTELLLNLIKFFNPVVELIDKFENLEVLSLRNINLTLGGLKMLVNKIAKLTNLKVLYLELGTLTHKLHIVHHLVKIFPDLQNLENQLYLLYYLYLKK